MKLFDRFLGESKKHGSRTVPVKRTADELLSEDWEDTIQDAVYEIEAAPNEEIDLDDSGKFADRYGIDNKVLFNGGLSAVWFTTSAMQFAAGDTLAGSFSGAAGVGWGVLAYGKAKEEVDEGLDDTPVKIGEAREKLNESREQYGDRFAVVYLDGAEKRVDTSTNMAEIVKHLDNISRQADDIEITYDQHEENPFFSLGVKGEYRDLPVPDYRADEYEGNKTHEIVITGLDPDYEFHGKDDFYDQVSAVKGTTIDEKLEEGRREKELEKV